MYRRMVASSNPTVLTQYPRAQKCIPVTRRWPSTCLCIRTALLPFKNPITNAMLNLGGTRRHICTWSDCRWPSSRSTPRCRHRSRIISPTRRRTFPYSVRRLNFGTNTTWYLQSHRTCDRLSHSCMGSSSCSDGAFPGEEPILFLPGSVEPLRVLRHRRRVSAMN